MGQWNGMCVWGALNTSVSGETTPPVPLLHGAGGGRLHCLPRWTPTLSAHCLGVGQHTLPGRPIRVFLQGLTWKLALSPNQKKCKTKPWRFGGYFFPPWGGKSPNLPEMRKNLKKKLAAWSIYIRSSEALRKRGGKIRILRGQNIFRGQWRYNLTIVGISEVKTL